MSRSTLLPRDEQESPRGQVFTACLTVILESGGKCGAILLKEEPRWRLFSVVNLLFKMAFFF